MGGQVVTLRDVFWHKEEPWGVVQLRSGMRTAIPLLWTDVPEDVFPTRMPSPQIDALRLVEMSRFLQQMNPQTTRSTKRKPRRTSNRAE